MRKIFFKPSWNTFEVLFYGWACQAAWAGNWALYAALLVFGLVLGNIFMYREESPKQ